MCCSSPCFLVLLCTHYRPLQCFSTYFRKLKEIRVLRPIFPDYVISCDYDHGHCNAEPTIIRRVLRENLENNCHRDLDDKPENTKKDSY